MPPVTLPASACASAGERARRAGDVARSLATNRARFLGFLERRVGRRDLAEEILQDAYVRSLDRAATLRREESAVAWFYRLLRNALTDHVRRRSAERRALVALVVEPATGPSPALDEELMSAVCGCVE